MKSTDTREAIIKRRGYRKNIVGDKFSLYISSYPVAINYLRHRVGNPQKVIAELCCGIGVTLEHIASGFKKVIGVDIDKKVLAYCEENLRSAGLLQKSTLILGDVNDGAVLEKIQADIVIYDIPFWSPHENKNQGDLTKKNPALRSTINRIGKFITKDIIIFCSPKFDYQLIKNRLGVCEFQKVYVNNKHDRNHVYLGELKKKDGITTLRLST
ncbi:class I SAM-dependent methyltransferase [Patescibacteria group bacterium]